MNWQEQQRQIYIQQQAEKEQAKQRVAEQERIKLKKQFDEQRQRDAEQIAIRKQHAQEQRRKEQEQQNAAMQRIKESLERANQEAQARQREARERAKQYKREQTKESPIEQAFREAWYQKYPDIKLEFQYHLGRYRVDIAHLPTKTYAELDGAQYHSGTRRIAYDSNRQRDLVLLGWLPVRFGGLEINLDVEHCIDQFYAIITKASLDDDTAKRETVRKEP